MRESISSALVLIREASQSQCQGWLQASSIVRLNACGLTKPLGLTAFAGSQDVHGWACTRSNSLSAEGPVVALASKSAGRAPQ